MFLPNVFLEKKIEFVKGIGPVRAELLKRELDILRVEDLLLDFPIRYIDRTKILSIRDAGTANEYVQLKGVLKDFRVVGQGRGRRLIGFLTDQSGGIELVWFKIGRAHV